MSLAPPGRIPGDLRAQKKWRWIGICAALIGVGLLVSGGGVLLARLANRMTEYAPVARTLPAELAAAKREVLPLTPADLRPVPPVAPAQNAASLYRKADVLYKRTLKAKRDDDGAAIVAFLRSAERHTTSEAERMRVRAVLARSAPLLRLAEQAAARPHCDFNRPWEQGARMLLPEYATVRHLARLLAVRALLQNEAGQPEAALQSIAAGARIGRHMGEEPIAIAALVRVAVHTILDRPFRDVLRRYPNRPDVLRMARETQRAFGPPLDLRSSLRGEVVLVRSMMDEVRADPNDFYDIGPVAQHLPGLAVDPRLRRTIPDAWEARMLNYWRRAFQEMNAANGDLLETYHALKTLGDEQDKKAAQPTYEMSAFLMPAFSGAALKALQSEAERRLRDTAIALLARRQRTGAFPATLAELPAPPLADPFTGHTPLRYRRTGRGFLLYSIGPNFRDDNGDSARKKKGEQPPDLVFAYP